MKIYKDYEILGMIEKHFEGEYVGDNFFFSQFNIYSTNQVKMTFISFTPIII